MKDKELIDDLKLVMEKYSNEFKIWWDTHKNDFTWWHIRDLIKYCSNYFDIWWPDKAIDPLKVYIEKSLDLWYESPDHVIMDLMKYCHDKIDIWLPDVIKLCKANNYIIPSIYIIIESVKYYKEIKPVITRILLNMSL